VRRNIQIGDKWILIQGILSYPILRHTCSSRTVPPVAYFDPKKATWQCYKCGARSSRITSDVALLAGASQIDFPGKVVDKHMMEK
jgi:hypothetical protein